MSNCQSVVASITSCLRNNSEDEDLVKRFWQQWQEYRDYLYRYCLKWMGGNPTDAEDALSRAMLKAWEKVQKYAEEIANFKAWLTRLTHNLCVDIHRERDRSANRVENIEVYASNEEQGLVRSEETPESAMETGEKRIVIRRAIDNLPTRLRETFILHFYQELSYQEIVQQQEISYQNVCKRISQARAILREELRGYFIDEDRIDTDKSVTPTMEVTESAIGEISKGNAGVEPIAIEMVTLSVAVEEVESVVGEESIEVVRSMQHSEPAPVVGAVSPNLQVGYSISKSQAAIQNDLDSNNTISFGMTTSQASGESVSVSIEGQAGFSVGSWLTFATTAGGSYDMSKSQGTSTDASIKLTWKGYSVVPMAPTAWQQATNVGWYYTDPIAQAVNNGTQDVTGFKFLNKPAYDLQPFAKGGNFGLLNNLVISNYPTIEITYKNANFSSFKQSWNQSVSGNLKLFGFIELGSFSQGAYGSSYQQGADNSTFTVTFSASKEVLSVPQLQKTAYVIGGAVTNPGVTSSQQVEQLVSV
ncbi:RNA polymerase sigma factor [Nostoc sp. DSM 114167]|jgi:RNA polymerase sigma factor (sigma-70 family)|uniref:RNA polymerase sigma factor n=1 Tax=Nostoc sp. DSM 114167 TaxID=3439050 RepID=UPI004045FC80